MSVRDRVHVLEERLLSDNWYILKTTHFEFRRSDGRWQAQHRESYDRGNGAAILLYSLPRRTVIMTRQFRYPAFVNHHDDLMIEVPAGLLDEADPETRIRAEAEEEAGYRVGTVHKVCEAFMSPGAVTERLHLFIAEYDPRDKVSDGGGLEHEGEDIEVFELDFDEAMAMVADGRICDAKTIMLLQYAALNLFPSRV